jgi:hypothetical protein
MLEHRSELAYNVSRISTCRFLDHAAMFLAVMSVESCWTSTSTELRHSPNQGGPTMYPAQSARQSQSRRPAGRGPRLLLHQPEPSPGVLHLREGLPREFAPTVAGERLRLIG